MKLRTAALWATLVVVASIGMVGCKNKVKLFQGQFNFVMSAEAKTLAGKLADEINAKTPTNTAPGAQQPVGINASDLLKEFEKSWFTINPDKTFKMYDAVEKEQSGTWELASGQLTLSYTFSEDGSKYSRKITLTNDETKQMLIRDYSGIKIYYKKVK